MNVEKIDSKKESAIPFPKLMESKEYGYIVLFTESRRGAVVYVEEGDEQRSIGEHSTEWTMHWFKDFTGKLISSN